MEKYYFLSAIYLQKCVGSWRSAYEFVGVEAGSRGQPTGNDH